MNETTAWVMTAIFGVLTLGFGFVIVASAVDEATFQIDFRLLFGGLSLLMITGYCFRRGTYLRSQRSRRESK